jgi:phosphotransferase system enzyme I (PtsI)
MANERVFRGISASPGFAIGKTFVAGRAKKAKYIRRKTAEAEHKNLVYSIENAIEETAMLVASATGDAADILEFQFEMLGDDTFADAAKELIDGGLAADEAWTQVLDAEIETYTQSDEEYFRARAADLMDIRDRVLRCLRGGSEEVIPNEVIYVADDIAPSAFLGHTWENGGIALRKGSATSHVAMLARQKAIPMIVRIGDGDIASGLTTVLDAQAGYIAVNPEDETLRAWKQGFYAFDEDAIISAQFAPKPARTADDHPLTVLVNIADPAETETIDIAHVDGVGLMRTEFLYNHGLPDEESQYSAYCKVLTWAKGKPVTIRTVDAGGDKPVPGFTEAEDNAFLGVRGIRLCLAKREVFAVQVRALLRAAAVHDNLKVMLPMVSITEEVRDAKAIFKREQENLKAAGIACGWPEIGIMVEVPAVAIDPWRFEQPKFFSIGSNDLTQYVMAASRDNGALSALARSDNPAVLALIENVTRCGAETNRPVSLCGDAASDPDMIEMLVGAGVTVFSVAAARIGAVKAAISKVNYLTTRNARDRRRR